MIFQGKIPQETRVFVRIALQYKGMGLSEIMAKCGLGQSTAYSILRGVKTT